jgi:DNA-binding NtrC family response regulator
MTEMEKKPLKVLIAEDEDDILTLYRDYFSARGHIVVSSSITGNDVMGDFEKTMPDICLIDYRLVGNTNGIDAAMKILNKYPSTPILIITGYGHVSEELRTHPELVGKNIEVLLKPVKMTKIEDAMWKLAHKMKKD